MRPYLLLAFLTLAPLTTHADYCAERSDSAFAELSRALGSAPEGERRAGALEVLEQLCRDAQSGAATGDPATAGEKEGKSTNLFGIEFKEAPEGAPGYERVRKSP